MSAGYLEESLDYAFDAAGCYDVWSALTPAQRLEIAESLYTSIENMSTATGRDCIPNPLENELRTQKAAHASETKRLEDARDQEVKELRNTISNLRWALDDARQQAQSQDRGWR